MDVTQVKEWIESANNFKRKALEATKQANICLSKARELCEHPAVEIEEVYYEGNYMDKAISTYYTSCAICGKSLKTETY